MFIHFRTKFKYWGKQCPFSCWRKSLVVTIWVIKGKRRKQTEGNCRHNQTLNTRCQAILNQLLPLYNWISCSAILRQYDKTYWNLFLSTFKTTQRNPYTSSTHSLLLLSCSAEFCYSARAHDFPIFCLCACACASYIAFFIHTFVSSLESQKRGNLRFRCWDLNWMLLRIFRLNFQLNSTKL